jgi:predicted ester cyclase
MSVEENKQLVRRYQDIYNSNHLEELDDVMAADVRTPKIISGFPPGLEGAKKVHELSLLGMTDFHTEILDMIAEGDKVVARVNITGLHTGNFFGIPATGKHVEFSGMYLVRIENGKIVEHWGEEDGVRLLEQLGMIPRMGES